MSVPVLRKDFIIDRGRSTSPCRRRGRHPADRRNARLGRADGPADPATDLTLTVLLEVHDADTLLAVRSIIGFPRTGYNLLGINNRDLTTMDVDVNTTSRLASLLDESHGLVAESGIKTRADVRKVRAAGATAVLVGQSLCQEGDIAKKFAELFG